LLLDYGYMLSYGLFFALAGFAVRDTAQARGWDRLAAIGVVFPFFALAAASFDASENVALLPRSPATAAASPRRSPSSTVMHVPRRNIELKATNPNPSASLPIDMGARGACNTHRHGQAARL
jgi:hypothetical protein